MGVIATPELVMTRNLMQKSKSSSSVGGGGGGGGAGTGGGGGRGLISKSSRIFKSRSKSTTRANTSSSGSAPCSWAPQGKCRWRSPSGKTITLESTNALALSELERSTLVEVALEKLKSINLGVEVKLPKEKAASGATTKKRRPYLLKKKALSTGFFEGGKRDEKESSGGSGMVFGISLSTCVANDRLRQGVQGGAGGGSGGGSTATQPPQAATATTTTTTTQGSTPYYRKRSQNGSRNSVADVQMGREDKGSTESLLFWGKRGSVAAVETIPAAVGQPPSMDILQPPLPSVPSIVTACVQHLENYGLHTTGIFRVSTSLKRIRQLREEIDGGKDVEFGEEHSPHDVAALLKEFLRDLPDPLLSRELYQPFLKTQKIRNRKQQLEAVQHLVQLLPAANRDTLASLLAFFAKVVANAGETRSSGGELLPGNKMEGYSLATLIAPNILPCMEGGGTAGSGDHTLTKERRESIDVVNYMISNYTQLFEISPELLHDVYLHLMDTQPEAVEGLLKIKSGFVDDANDEMETSSVFEGSECGDLPEGEEVQTPQPQQRVFRRREDILHEGAAHGGPISGHSHHTSQPATAAAEPSGRLRGSDRVRGRRDSSRDRSGGAAVSDQEKGGQSGAESDTSSTKSSSRWFRRTRPDKTRTSSDSGSEKVKCFTSGGIATAHPTQKSGLESKRANSLDSVNMKESCSQGGGGGSSDVTGGATSQKEKSNSDQSLKVPENLNRRQSSPVLESAGVITASLKIPVPVPLNIDDTDIPFIEEDHQHHHSHYSSTRQHPIVPAASSTARSRGRSASTDSSAPIKSPQSSHTTTPISSPGRQPSSEVSSPLGFSPPGSPPYDTFPYEEMTARILLGGTAGTDQVTASTSTSTTMTSSVDKVVPAKVVTSLYLQPAANTPNANSSNSGGGNSGGPSCQTATASVYIPGVASDGKTHGKETTRHLGILSTTPSSGSAIGGLIKSKTADFEKLSKSTANSPTSSTATLTYSIAPKMRLRSQENIVLKQQFLLRQQQLQQQHPHYAHPSQEEGRRRDASNTPTPPPQTTSGHEANHKSTTVRSPSVKDMTTTEQQQQHGSPTHSPTSKSSPGSRGLTRRRQPLTGSASSSAIIPSSSHHSSSSLTSSDHHRPHHGSRHPPTVTEPQTVPTPAGSSGGGSPSRWKRSEIIASRHDDSPSDHGSGGGSSRSIGGGGGGTPETFL